MGTVNWDHFKAGMNIPEVQLVPQMKHFEKHLARTQNEWRWRDSKSARSRTLGFEMSQIDPIVAPDYFFEERGMKHFNGG